MSPDQKSYIALAAVLVVFAVAAYGVLSGTEETAPAQTATTSEPATAPAAAPSEAKAMAMPGADAQSESDQAKDVQNPYEVPGDMTLGNPAAKVTVIEYASVTCGHCANFHATVFDKLKETYIDTGKVYFIFREFPTPPADRAVAGFMLARCVPEERYFGFIDVLFRQQLKWVQAPDAYAALKKIALLSGMNDEQFRNCLNNQAELDRIRAVQEKGFEEYGVNSTPSFVINGKTYSNMQWEGFQQVLTPLVGP